MEDGRAPGTDDGAGLEAVWGREASATAPPAPRPDVAALFAGPAAEPDASPPRPRRGPVLAALAVAAVVAVVAAVVLLVGGDDPEADPADASPTSGAGAGPTTTTIPTLPDLPAWTAAAACPRIEDATGSGRTACDLATDDERVYALVDVRGVTTLRALDVATGRVRWEEGFAEGARTLERLPSVVVVGGVGSLVSARAAPWGPPGPSTTVALDPVTGARLWSRPGVVVGPVGPDHLVLDATPPSGERGAMAVVEATTGRDVLRRDVDAPLYLHPCGDATVLASEGDRLTAHAVDDGAARWSIPAPHLGGLSGLRCGAGRIAYVEGGTLVVLDADDASSLGGVTGMGEDGSSQVLAVVGDTVVVGSLDGARGFGVGDGEVVERWHLPCTECGPDLLVGEAGDGRGPGAEDVVVVLGGEAVVPSEGDERPEARLVLDVGTEKVLAEASLVAWDAGALTWARLPGLDRAIRIGVQGARTAAVGSAHVVVATEDQVRAYHREDPGG